MKIGRLSALFGTEITAVRLDADDENQMAELRHAIASSPLVVIRTQAMTPQQQTRITRKLGSLGPAPFVATMPEAPDVIRVVKDVDDFDAPNFGGTWHTDYSFLQEPPAFTLLHAVELPPHGGDTLFADQSLVYSALKNDVRVELKSLVGVHSPASALPRLASALRHMTISAVGAGNMRQRHPLVCRHPIADVEYLYFNPTYVIDIEAADGSIRTEMAPLLTRLATSSSVTYRHRWRPGDFVICDNRLLLHRALDDYPRRRRVLHRTTVAGSAPMRA